jgi:hypothetical protein
MLRVGHNWSEHVNERNPYAPPVADVHDVVTVETGRDDVLVPYGRRRPAKHGLDWIAGSWTLFRDHPGLWIAAVLAGYGTTILGSLIPGVNVAVAAASPLLNAGFMAIADAGHRRRPVSLVDLLAGFSRVRPLLTIGAGYLALWAVCVGVLVALDGPDWIQIAAGSADPVVLQGRLPMLFGYLLLMMGNSLLIAFAPTLVLLNDVPPLTAMRMSAVACVKNVLPGLVCAFTMGTMLVLAVLPLGLGLLVVLPLVVITFYTAYRDIFLEAGGRDPEA